MSVVGMAQLLWKDNLAVFCKIKHAVTIMIQQLHSWAFIPDKRKLKFTQTSIQIKLLFIGALFVITPNGKQSIVWYICTMEYCCMCVSCSVMSNFANPWSVACQAPLSVEFSRQECCSRQQFPSPGDLPDPEI